MEWVKLGDIAEIKKGKKVEQCEANINAVRYIQIEDLRHNDEMKFTSDPKAVMANSEDVLIVWDGANAGTVSFDLEGAIGSTISKISIKEKKKKELLPQYLGIFLQSKEDYLRQTTTGATIPHINKQAVVQLAVPLFTLEIQNKIIELNDNLGSIIAKRREQIDALDALVSSVFYEMFGDPNVNPKYKNMVKLGDLGEWKSGGTPKRSVKEYYGGSIPWVTSGELNEIYICDALEKITRNAIAESNAKLVEKGSLLLGMYDSAGLKSSINLCTLATNQAIAFSKLNSEISNTIYIYHLIQIQRESLIQQQRGVRQKNFNLSMIKDINITLPPIALQNRFADYVTSIEAQKESLRASLSELETLFDALMQVAFSGHLN